MIYHYLDASAWVKRYSQEIGTVWIQNFSRSRRQTNDFTIGKVTDVFHPIAIIPVLICS